MKIQSVSYNYNTNKYTNSNAHLRDRCPHVNNYNQTFGTKRLRVPRIFVTRSFLDWLLHNPLIRGGFVNEYYGPNARAIYEELNMTLDPRKRSLLQIKMGCYERKPMNIIERFSATFDTLWELIKRPRASAHSVSE